MNYARNAQKIKRIVLKFQSIRLNVARYLFLFPAEYGDGGFVYGGGDGLAAVVVLASAVVAPAAFALGKVGLPLGYSRLGDGTDEQ